MLPEEKNQVLKVLEIAKSVNAENDSELVAILMMKILKK